MENMTKVKNTVNVYTVQVGQKLWIRARDGFHMPEVIECVVTEKNKHNRSFTVSGTYALGHPYCVTFTHSHIGFLVFFTEDEAKRSLIED